MPKYAYECDACAKEWAIWAAISDSPPSECPYCAEGSPFKILSKFVTMRKDKVETKSAKDNVIEHIEDNKIILQQMKQETREKKK